MSGICGIVNFDGAPVDPDALRRMTDAMAHLGPDGTRHWVDGNAALGHCMLHTTPESVREVQPLEAPDGRLVLLADARIDNRAEIIHSLAAIGYAADDPTDADLILQAYLAWGERCPERLIGDFAFAILDRKAREVLCARDVMGVRPLYYAFDGKQFLWASEIGPILKIRSQCKKPDEIAVASWLTGNFEALREHTFYENVRRLPAATLMRVDVAGPHRRRYWDFEPDQEVRYSTDQQYIEHFRELFQQAVTARLRATGPVGVFVSGGLDSSSILCTAAQLCKPSVPGEPELIPICFAYREMRRADERRFQAAVLKKWGLRGIVVAGDEEWALKYYGTPDYRHHEEPLRGNTEILEVALPTLKEREARVVFSGVGGDQVLNSGYYSQPELLWDLPIRRWPQMLRHYRRRRTTWADIAKGLVREFGWARSLRDRAGGFRHSGVTLASPDLLRRTGVNSRRARVTRKFMRRSQQTLYDNLVSMSNTGYPLLGASSVISRFGMQHALPFLDRRVMTFLLEAPPELRNRNGQTKYILREAMRGVLPEIVRQRSGHGTFNDFTIKGLAERERSKVEGLLTDPVCVQQGYVDAHALRRLWNGCCAEDDLRRTNLLAGAANLEIWLRGLDNSVE